IAQKSEVYPLLTHGVRYLDIRIAEHDGEWYGCHGLLAAPIDGFLIDTIRFLSKTDGEFVVVELRHTYFETVGYYELFEYIASVKYEGKSLLDYVRYDKNDTPLEELRYNDVVNGGSGVIFVMREGPTDMFVGYIYDDEGNVSKTIIQWGGSTIATGKDYDLDVIFRNFKGVYGEVVYDPWHNQTTDKKMLEGIRETAALLKENKETYTSVFRINQAQKTPKFELDSIPASLFGWSLLDLANRFNAKLLEQPDFKEWLSVMPVFQVDYADSMKGGFNDKVVAILNEYNRGL
ncbi:MAG: hypothetical protein LBT20_00225, partial [Clostridiales bacterium]|nr:hypothetical protein [Clostridiales bacterium]